MSAALDYARDNRDRYLSELKDWLNIASVSTLPEHADDVLAAGEWVAEQLRGMGVEHVALLPTPGFPMVYGDWLHAPGKPTVLVYGHYDVQPVDPLNEWNTPPFDATVVGEHLIARGASDMKGQIFAQIKSVEALVRTGQLPVNIRYLIEGEEEIGSPNLAAFIAANKDLLQCDVVLNCDCGIHAPDLPSVTYSLRGLDYFEVEIHTLKKDQHSGRFGGSVRNPIHELCKLIDGLHDDHGRVTLPGFYDKVRALPDDERAELARIPYTDKHWMEMAGADALYGEEGYTSIERVGARPMLDVNGIWGGFTGAGAKTVLPSKAFAKFSTRLVADQHVDDIRGIIEEYLKANVAEGVTWKLHQHSAGPGAIMDRKSTHMQAARAALKEIWGVDPIFTREGGSVPVVAHLQQMLGVDSIMLGFALPDDGIHGPNERQYLPNTWRGIEAYIRFLELL